MKSSMLRILCGSATAALLAVGPVAVAHAAPTVPRLAAAGSDPCNGDPNCSSGGATSPSGGASQAGPPANGAPASPPPSGGSTQPGSPPPSGGGTQPGSPPPSGGGTQPG